MMSKWTENIGTPEYPVSYLHEYAVALIWDRLSAGECFVKTTASEYEHLTVPEGGRVDIPDELTPIAGTVPDIAIYDSSHRPITAVEVHVTSSPSKDKMARMERLGVKMVIVPVPNEEALLTMFRPVSTDEVFPNLSIPRKFRGHTKLLENLYRNTGRESVSSRTRKHNARRSLEDSNYAVINLIRHLRMCDPTLRQELRAVLDELDSIESRHPILPGNPKLPVLQQKDKACEVE